MKICLGSTEAFGNFRNTLGTLRTLTLLSPTIPNILSLGSLARELHEELNAVNKPIALAREYPPMSSEVIKTALIL